MTRITVKDKLVNYEDAGSGTPLLWLHGYCMDLHLWDAQVRDLSRTHRVITVDMPGHGGSDGPDEGTSFEDLADLMMGMLDELGVDGFHVAGMSMGGFTAARMAVAHPDRVQSLVLVASAPRAEVNEAFAGMVEGFRAGMRDTIIPLVVTLQMEPGTEDRDPELIKKQIERIQATVSTDTLVRYGEAVLNQSDVTGRLAELSCRVLLVHGTADQGIDVEESRELVRHLPNARLVEIEGGGHNINIQSAGQVTAALRAFYDEVA